jgi:nucleoside-triphosphatase THEP1
MKASVIGSIWAAIEIIAGSFLHNLKVPAAGTLLSMISVALLVLFIRHWKETGIIVRAGIICALMKSISPSAVILGPMAAIFMEGLIIELILLIFRRNLFSFMVAGALAVTWALVQKIVSLLIIYGFDLIRIAEAFYDFLVTISGLEQLSPTWLIITITGLYLLAGAFAALIGFLSYPGSHGREVAHSTYTGAKRPDILIPNEKQQFSVASIVVIIVCMVMILYLVNESVLPVYGIAGTVFIAFIIARYKQSLRYFRKPRTWIQFTFLAFIAALAWEGMQTGNYFSVEGLLIGLRMVFRAMIIILGLSAIGVELRNPLIKSLLFRNGMAPLYHSLSLSFSALPAVIRAFPELRNLWKQRKALASLTLRVSEGLLEDIKKETEPRENIYLISGKPQSGKTTLLTDLIQSLEDKGFMVEGVLAHGVMTKGQRTSFRVEILPEGTSYLLSDVTPREGWQRFRRFYFDPSVFSTVTEALTRRRSPNTSPFVLDEVGPMELTGKGWFELLNQLKNQRDRLQLWVVREKLVREVMLHYAIPAKNVFRVEESTAQAICRTIC